MAAAAEAKLNPAPLAHAAALAERAGASAEAVASARAQAERIEAEPARLVRPLSPRSRHFFTHFPVLTYPPPPPHLTTPCFQFSSIPSPPPVTLLRPPPIAI